MARIAAGERVRPEGYYDTVLTGWLPRRWDRPQYEQGLQALARLSQERHGDRWLRDAMAAARSERLRRGHHALGNALSANLADEPQRAMVLAREAAADLRTAGDRAGTLRAELELVYGLHRSFNGKECVARALAVESDAAASAYLWILGQARIELGICRAILGDSGGAYRDMARALETARKAGYSTLELRADAVLTGEQANAGNLLAAWERSRAGLERFWSEAHPPIRGQHYKTLLRRAAEQLELRHAAFAFARAGVAAAGETGHRLLTAVGHAQAARSARAAGLASEALAEYAEADRLFSVLGNSKAAREHRLFAEIDRAEAEAEAGDAAAALRRLETLRDPVSGTDSLLMRLRFHQAAGEAHRLADQPEAAETEWRRAIGLYEQRLGSLKEFDERLSALRPARRAHRGLVWLLWQRSGAEAALEEWEWFRAAEWPGPRRRLPLPLSTLKHETFLAFSNLPGGAVVWAFDDRGVKAGRVAADGEDLRRKSERLSRLCADPASDPRAIRSLARELYRTLIAPVERHLDPRRTLVIEPDGPMSAVPFAVLLDGDSRYLGLQFNLVVAGGVWDYLRRSRRPRVDPAAAALVVADPALGGEARRAYPPLPGAAREGQAVASRFPKAMLLEGAEATLEAVDRRRGRAELFHFAGHGFSHAGNGGLLLAPAGDADPVGSQVLDGKRLAGQDWSRCRLAVLSACSTGTGESGGPANPESLVRRLL